MPVPAAKTVVPATEVSSGFYSSDFQSLGSTCKLLYKAKSEESAGEFHRDVICWVNAFEARYSRHIAHSLISEINRNAGEGWIEIDAETDRIFALCDRAYVLSQGRFDPSALPLIQLWDYRQSRTCLPNAVEIKEALTLVGWGHIERHKGSIRLPVKGMGIDVGGIGKEYTVDAVLSLALERGITDILVDFGQDLRVHGNPPDGDSWRIGLENPSDPEKCWSGVMAKDCAVATSGDYRRNFLFNGRRYGHIIDPRNGYPVSNGCLAVSVVAPLCTNAGVLATAAYVLGPEMGIKLIENQYGAAGCIVTETGRSETANFNQYCIKT